jgi:hypothetical protein
MAGRSAHRYYRSAQAIFITSAALKSRGTPHKSDMRSKLTPPH